MAHSASTQRQHYYVPQPMYWPVLGSISLFLMMLGGVFVMNASSSGWVGVATGFMLLLYMMFRWFGDVIAESEGGKYHGWEDVSFRWGMSWFIFSEVMFFAAFFGALFYILLMSVPDLASLDPEETLWPSFKGVWPSAGPGFEEKFSPMGAWGLPAINTLLLLSSGVTVTLAHWALLRNDRNKLIAWMFATIGLGVLFLGFQIYEYGHAYSELNLKLTTGAYGATFFMLTGFHGFHVTVGCIMLTTILFRCVAGHFKPDHHFGFEGVAWYWHFVDVVWLGLFIFVYWL